MSRNWKYGGRSEEPAEKPYKLIPLPKEVKRERPQGHDRFQKGMLTGTLRGKIIALSHIHIASGILELGEHLATPTGGKNPNIVKALVRSNSIPIIPGSSLKGAIRSVVEAISPSCLCKTRARFNEVPHGFGECRRKESLCVACHMFGAMGFQGNIRIADATLNPNSDGKYVTHVESIPALYQPSTRRRAYYEHGQIVGRKFYLHGRRASGDTPIEVCPEGSVFQFILNFENLEYEELGLLYIAIGVSEQYPFRLKIGGAKPACYGTLKFELEELIARRSMIESYLEFDEPYSDSYAGDSLKEYVNATMNMTLASRKIIIIEQLNKLAEILKYPNDRECPSGLY